MKKVSKSLMVLSVVGMLFATPYGEANRGCVDSADCTQESNRIEIRHKNMFKEINLTTEQEVKIKEIFKKYKSCPEGEAPQVRDARVELMKELDSAQPSEQKIKELKKEIVNFQAKRLDEMISMKQEMNGVLTEEQIAKLKELKENNKEDKENHKKTSKDKKKWNFFKAKD